MCMIFIFALLKSKSEARRDTPEFLTKIHSSIHIVALEIDWAKYFFFAQFLLNGHRSENLKFRTDLQDKQRMIGQ